MLWYQTVLQKVGWKYYSYLKINFWIKKRVFNGFSVSCLWKNKSYQKNWVIFYYHKVFLFLFQFTPHIIPLDIFIKETNFLFIYWVRCRFWKHRILLFEPVRSSSIDNRFLFFNTYKCLNVDGPLPTIVVNAAGS